MFNIGGTEQKGILLLLSLEERQVRIKIGDGITKKLTSRKSGQIQDDYMIPYFEVDRFDEGIQNGYNTLIQMICNEYNVTVNVNQPEIVQSNNIIKIIMTVGKMLIIFCVIDYLVLALLKGLKHLEAFTIKKILIIDVLYFSISIVALFIIMDMKIRYGSQYFNISFLIIVLFKLILLLFGTSDILSNKEYHHIDNNDDMYDDEDNNDIFTSSGNSTWKGRTGNRGFSKGRGSTRKF